MLRLVPALLLVACSSEPPRMEQPVDAPTPDVAIDGPAVCTPMGPCDWLASYQRRIVGSLSGERDISPGLRLAHRASVAERDAARQFLLDEFAALGITARRHDYTSGTLVGANVIATLDPTAGTG